MTTDDPGQAAALSKLEGSRPVSAELLRQLTEAADDAGRLELQDFANAMVHAIVSLEGALVRETSDTPVEAIDVDIKVPLTLYGKTYYITP